MTKTSRWAHHSKQTADGHGDPAAFRTRVQDFLAKTADAALVLDADGAITWANPATAALAGVSAEDLAGQPLSAVLSFDDARGHPDAGSEAGHTAAWLRHVSGDHIPVAIWRLDFMVETTASVILLRPLEGEHAAAGVRAELQAAQATARSANRALRESEERFRGAFDGAPIGMALVACDGRFLQVNPALCGILGYSDEELLGTTFQAITQAPDVETDAVLIEQLLADEITSYQIEKGYVGKNGNIILGRLTASLVRDAAGEPLYFVCQVQDITPYKAAGRALREAEKRYRSLVEQIPAVVYVDRPDGLSSSLYVSPRVETMLGYTVEEWLATPDAWLQYVHPDDRAGVLAAVAGAMETGEAIQIEYRFLARDGDIVWVHDTCELIHDEDDVPQYWQGLFVDITDQKYAEEQLRAAKESAEEASRLKSAFLSMATHELRTPLTIISGYVELLAASEAELSGEEREFLEMVQTSARSLAALVNDLLDLARIEAGRLELELCPVDVAQTVERVRRMVARQAIAKEIALVVSMAPGLPPVAADPDRLFQILLNLMGNAIKFTEVGDVRVTGRTIGNGVELEISDTGIGISAEALPRIFDEFRQADAGTTRKYGGSGLGLAIAKRLIEMHHGTISVTSTLGVGSTFTVWLPSAVDLPKDNGRPTLRRGRMTRRKDLSQEQAVEA
ncbi:MAG: PAS domain S-box protein [Thermomicrobiales bacterium]